MLHNQHLRKQDSPKCKSSRRALDLQWNEHDKNITTKAKCIPTKHIYITLGVGFTGIWPTVENTLMNNYIRSSVEQSCTHATVDITSVIVTEMVGHTQFQHASMQRTQNRTHNYALLAQRGTVGKRMMWVPRPEECSKTYPSQYLYNVHYYFDTTNH